MESGRPDGISSGQIDQVSGRGRRMLLNLRAFADCKTIQIEQNSPPQ